jgi:hypothetical protein
MIHRSPRPSIRTPAENLADRKKYRLIVPENARHRGAAVEW